MALRCAFAATVCSPENTGPDMQKWWGMINVAPLMQTKDRREDRSLRACTRAVCALGDALWQRLGDHRRRGLNDRGSGGDEQGDGGEDKRGHDQNEGRVVVIGGAPGLGLR